MEYCEPAIIIERDLYYLDNLEFENNTLKIARSLIGFKHSTYTIDRMSKAKLGRARVEVTKLKLSANSQAHTFLATKNETGEDKVFSFFIKAAEFLGMHHSYLYKCLK